MNRVDIAPRLPCPVCLGTNMEKVRFGTAGSVTVDHCRRCGGLWLEQGEVQQLRGVPKAELWSRIDRQRSDSLTRCHDCHSPLDRAAERCGVCGASNVLDCPDCDSPMTVETFRGLRLDVCRKCKGAWFDHHELEEIWTAAFDRSLQKRHLSRAGDAMGDVTGVGGEILMHSVFFAPELLFYGAYAAGHAASAAAQAAASTPDAIAAAPEVAAGAFEAVGEAAGSVFEVIVEIIGGIFDSL